MRHIAVIAAMLLALCIFPTSIYAMQNEQVNIDTSKTITINTDESGGPEAIAIDFLKNSHTFKFDGIESSIQVQDIIAARKIPILYIITIDFTSTSAGYGDRSGEMVAQVLTDHTMVVQVENGTVISAVIDGAWDEIDQKDLEATPEDINTIYMAPEAIRDSVISYLITTYGLGIPAPSEWVVTDATPEGLLGYQTLVYTSGDWTVYVKHAVVLTPVYSVGVEYNGVNAFTWSGSVRAQIIIEEFENTIQNPDETVYYTVEDTRDMALKHLQSAHPEVNVPYPGEWVETNLIPEGLVGVTKIQYICEGWAITVSAPVVWKPTYEITIEHITTPSVYWSGTLPTGGEISETNFSK